MHLYKWTNINGQILDLQLYNYIFLRFHENNIFGEILKKYLLHFQPHNSEGTIFKRELQKVIDKKTFIQH